MGRLPLLLGLIPFLLLPAACAPRRIAESILLGSHYEMLGDVSYGPAPQHRLDVYRPRGKLDPRFRSSSSSTAAAGSTAPERSTGCWVMR